VLLILPWIKLWFVNVVSKYFKVFLFGLWGYWHCGHSWPIVPASGGSEDDCGEADGMYVDWKGKPKFSGKKNLPQRHFCPSQNPTWPDLGLNSGSSGGKPATNRLSYGAAYFNVSTFSNNIFAILYYDSVLHYGGETSKYVYYSLYYISASCCINSSLLVVHYRL
jgi:hypothetical protein